VFFEQFEHSSGHGDINHGFAGFGVSFVIFGVSTVFVDPCEGTFDDSSFPLHDEALHIDWSQHRLH